jgi:lysophospholipase L1-like esterase
MKRCVQVGGSALIILLLLEATLWLAGVPRSASRTLFWSSPLFTMDSMGAVSYTPDTTVRQAAVYGGKIEYDVTYEINNLGLVDDQDYNASSARRRVAIVGDSFTEGIHGGVPWVPALRRRWLGADTEVYNLGISATGIVQFHRLLRRVSRQVSFNEIVIVAISNDFYRDVWYSLVVDGEVKLCRPEVTETDCRNASPVAYVAQPGDDVVGMASRLETSRVHSRLGRVATILWQRGMAWWRNRGVMQKSLTALEDIWREFPDIPVTVVHVPEREEAIAGRYGLEIRAEVEQRGMAYVPALNACGWSPALYLHLDSHPNQRGYDAIARCVEEHVLKR